MKYGDPNYDGLTRSAVANRQSLLNFGCRPDIISLNSMFLEKSIKSFSPRRNAYSTSLN